MKLGLCLSGGGARGIAHIGVLKALEEHRIFPKYVSGASAGAIVGALYATGKTTDEILQIVHQTNLFKIFRFGSLTGGFAKLTYLREILAEALSSQDFKDLSCTFFVGVSDVKKGKSVILENGNIIDAVVASSSIPLMFEPVEIEGELYVDGGLLNNLPIEPLMNICDMVIGVNVMPNTVQSEISGLLSMAERCFDLVIWNNSAERAAQCDVLINMEGVEEFGIFDFQKAEEIVELGYRHAIKMMPTIIQNLRILECGGKLRR